VDKLCMFFFRRYLKDYDYYEKCRGEREAEEKKLLKQGRASSGCLCFISNKQRTPNVEVAVVWRRALGLALALLLIVILAVPVVTLYIISHWLSSLGTSGSFNFFKFFMQRCLFTYDSLSTYIHRHWHLTNLASFILSRL